MDNIIIKEVSGRCQLRKFIQFPNLLFKDVPTYIPPLMMDELNLLTSKNPSLDHCDLKLWLAWHDGKIVGRVAGIINHSVNERWNKKCVNCEYETSETFDRGEDGELATGHNHDTSGYCQNNCGESCSSCNYNAHSSSVYHF